MRGLKHRLLKAADAMHAGAQEIENYVANLESMGFDFDGTTDDDTIVDKAFKLSDKGVGRILNNIERGG